MTAAVTGFTTTDRVEVSFHAREKWDDRADVTYPVEDLQHVGLMHWEGSQ